MATTTYPIGTVPAFAPSKIISVPNGSSGPLSNDLRNPDIKIRSEAVRRLESSLVLGRQGKCPNDIINNMKVRYFQISPELIGEYLQQPGMYDNNFQDGIACLVDAVLAPDGDTYINPPDVRLRSFISSTKLLGTSTTARVLQLGTADYPLFAAKVPFHDSSIFHEALIGMGAINTLRDKVPNFMHTYGILTCEPPIIDAQGNILTWCKNNPTNNTHYLLLENITNAKPLARLANSLTDDDFLQIYLQVLNALNVAYKKFDFTHYDLHAENVLIQELPYKISIPLYNPRGGILYIKTKYLARIIDFGMSHIYLQGQHFGSYGFRSYGILPEESFPMYDAYKLLLFTYNFSLGSYVNGRFERSKRNNKLTPLVTHIYSFFKENLSLEQRIENRYKNIDTDFFQPLPSSKSLKLDNLLIFILDKIGDTSFLSLTESPDLIPSICQGKCISWDDFTINVFDGNKLPSSITEFCHANRAIDALPDTPYKQSLRKWISQFDFNKYYNIERQTMFSRLRQISNSLNNIKLSLINPNNFDRHSYETAIYKILIARDVYFSCLSWLSSISCVSHYIHFTPNLLTEFNNFYVAINDILITFNRFREIINANIKIADDNFIKLSDNISLAQYLITSHW